MAMGMAAAGIVLLLLVLMKAAVEQQLGAHPGKTAMICFFLLLFAGFGIANALLYRRLNRGKLRAGANED